MQATTSSINVTSVQPRTTRDEDPSITPLTQLLTVSCVIMGQALTLLNDSITSDSHLTFVSKIVPGSTIGRQIRHAHAHFMLLLDSLDSPQGPWVVNYDVRKRDTPMEGSLVKAREAIVDLIQRLEKMKESVNVGVDDAMILNAVTPDRQVLHSSFGRELWFSALHAVHHWAMVRVIAHELSLPVDEHFGVAPSTLIYRGTDSPLAKARI